MAMNFIPKKGDEYYYTFPGGNVSSYSWAGDEIDMKISRTIGAWRPKEKGLAQLQSRMLEVITTSNVDHWSNLDHKTFWGWVDDYELHT